MSRAEAVIDLDAIAANVARLKRAAAGSRFMAVVKADAYGHGMSRVAPVARAAGADWLGVALPTEAVALRAEGDVGSVLCWIFTPGDDLVEAVALDIDLSASAAWQVDAVASAAQRAGRRARLHLKVDTGLGRGGSTASAWPVLIDTALAAQAAGSLDVVGLWSHLACADAPDQRFTRQQCELFDAAVALARGKGLRPDVLHMASSGGILVAPESHYDLVRGGISLYGLSPGRELGTPEELGLHPALTLTAEVANVKRVPAGHGVSYGLTYRTARETTLALIPLGYADGVPRSASGTLPIAINGERYRAAGRIAMDQFVVDVGDADVEPGDTAVLFGPGSSAVPSAEDWAEAAGSIVNEIVTRLGPRVPRRYVQRGPVSLREPRDNHMKLSAQDAGVSSWA